jgi:hypothetical protein
MLVEGVFKPDQDRFERKLTSISNTQKQLFRGLIQNFGELLQFVDVLGGRSQDPVCQLGLQLVEVSLLGVITFGLAG